MRLKGIKLREIYMGRFGIFAVISLLQSTFETLGCILFLKVQAVHPFLLVLTGWVAGLVFTFMIYTLVVSAGNAGKAVAVVFLVVQISGAGGAYPLQVLPAFFQNISPFLPATHAMNAVRSAIAGIYANDYWISMGYLVLFLVPTLLLGLVLRKPVINFNRKFVAATESTRLL
jgi:putative membrane protein